MKEFSGRWNLTLVLYYGLALVIPVQAASFDCGKATLKVENLICSDTELSKLDEELAVAYKTALQGGMQADSIRQTQKQWVKERNGCTDAKCVKHTYETRLSSIQSAVTNGDAKQRNSHGNGEQQIASPVEDATCIAPRVDWRNYEWTLIRGKGHAVCEEMLAYVKSRPKTLPPPTCPEERLPPNGHWTRPESRILSEVEKQALLSRAVEAEQAFLRNLPEQERRKQGGSFIADYVKQIKSTKQLRVIRGDITGDGIPESLLAFNSGDGGWTCQRSRQCARPEEIFKKGIVLTSDAYDLLPMNEAGTSVDWNHRSVNDIPLLMGGELVFYKRRPYWMTGVDWDQKLQDDFPNSSIRPDDPYSAIFTLSEIGVGTGTPGEKHPNFKNVTGVGIEHDPESNNVCRFGYFHRHNLKQHPPKGRK